MPERIYPQPPPLFRANVTTPAKWHLFACDDTMALGLRAYCGRGVLAVIAHEVATLDDLDPASICQNCLRIHRAFLRGR